MRNKRYYIMLIVLVISFGLLLAGGTYAWLVFGVDSITGNGLNTSSSCFIMHYSGNFNNGEIYPSKTDKGGLSGTVTLGIDSSCNVKAHGDIKLHVSDSTSSKYFENSALKYSVYNSDESKLLYSGIINSTGVKNLNTSSIQFTKTITTYKIYVWLDGTKIDNSYLNLSFSAYIDASATQDEQY